VSALAGVSTRTFYDRLGSMEACFLGSYDYAVKRARGRIGDAYGAREGDWQTRLRWAFAEFAAEVEENPKAARLVLVEALGAGPAAVARMQETRLAFEKMLVASFRDGGVALPPTVAKGIVCGVERIARQHLLAGNVRELLALEDDLARWLLSYHSSATVALRATNPTCPRDRAPSRPPAQGRCERVRVLQATARVAAEGGYEHLTVRQISVAAGISVEAFDALYDSTAQCFLASLSLLALEALRCAKGASQTSGQPLGGVHRGMVALMGHVASDPVLQRVAFVEVFAVGSAAIEHREALLHKFNELLITRVPEPLRLSNVTVEAIIGAIWGIVHHHVTQGTAHRLPALAGQLSYLALAPVIGGEAAVQVILAADDDAA